MTASATDPVDFADVPADVPGEALSLGGFFAAACAGNTSAAGRRFRPTDPADAAHAQAVPSGLTDSPVEDADGLGMPEDFTDIPSDMPLTAVDAGVVRLGNTEDGQLFCVSAAAVTTYPDGRPAHVDLVRPSPLYVSKANRVAFLHEAGLAMGKPDFYVNLDDSNMPTTEKVLLGPHAHQVADRARNVVERMLQRHIVERGKPGVLLIDGALTLRTYDTPGLFMKRMAADASACGISLVAVAKHTGLSVRGTDITTLLGSSGRPGRRKLTRAVRDEGMKDRFLGDLFVARFSAGGDTYRVDVSPADGLRSAPTLDRVYNGCRYRAGYPEPLLLAHVYSYATPPKVAQLQAYGIATLGLVVQPEINLGPIFAPFGGRFK